HAFKHEVPSTYKTLTALGVIAKKNTAISTEMVNLGGDSGPADTLAKAFKKRIAISHLSWIDSSGLEKYSWNIPNEPRPRENVSEMDYFKIIKNRDSTTFPITFDTTYPLKNDTDYYFAPLISFATGNFRTVLSKKS